MFIHFKLVLLGTIAPLVLLLSCSTPPLALQGVAWYDGHEMLEVKGRQGIWINQKLSFGAFTTNKVSRSWTKESSWSIGAAQKRLDVPTASNIISLNHINRKQTLRFASESASGQYADVFAATHVRAQELKIGEGNGWASFTIDISRLINKNSNNLYYVEIYMNGSKIPWHLVLDNETSQWQPDKYVGYLFGPNNYYYQLKPVQKYHNKQSKPVKLMLGNIGFEITNREGMGLAAINTLDKGSVYFSKLLAPQERFLLENLSAALLLQEHI